MPKCKSILCLISAFFISGCATTPRIEYLKPLNIPLYGDYEPIVYELDPDSDAIKSGLRVGDKILEVDGNLVKDIVSYTKAIKSSSEGTLKVERNNSQIVLNYQTTPEKRFGTSFWPERSTMVYPPGNGTLEYSHGTYERKNDIDIWVRVSGAKEYPFMGMLLIVSNRSQKSIMFFPENILVLDADNTILNMFGGKILASNVKESAERRFVDYSQSSANYVASVQAQSRPAYYTVSGTTQSYGSGNFYSYGNYGNYDYSGTAYSNYTVTPAPDFSGVGAALGRMIGLAIAKSELNKSLKVAENTYRTAFNFGEIPPGTNRVGLIYFDAPMYLPLQIKLKISGNDFYYKWDWDNAQEK